MGVKTIRDLRLQYERTSETAEAEGTTIVNIRLPLSMIASVDEFAKSKGFTRSKYLRDLIEVGHAEMLRLVVLSYGDGSEEAVPLDEVDPEGYAEKFPEDIYGEEPN